jgi:hypothetical protein
LVTAGLDAKLVVSSFGSGLVFTAIPSVTQFALTPTTDGARNGLGLGSAALDGNQADLWLTDRICPRPVDHRRGLERWDR